MLLFFYINSSIKYTIKIYIKYHYFIKERRRIWGIIIGNMRSTIKK